MEISSLVRTYGGADDGGGVGGDGVGGGCVGGGVHFPIKPLEFALESLSKLNDKDI